MDTKDALDDSDRPPDAGAGACIRLRGLLQFNDQPSWRLKVRADTEKCGSRLGRLDDSEAEASGNDREITTPDRHDPVQREDDSQWV